MKRIFTAIALVAMIGSAHAGYRGPNGHHGHHAPRVVHHHGGGWNQVWVPLIIGGVVGAAIANRPAQAEPIPAPVIYQQPQVVYQNTGRLVIDMNGGIQCSPGLAPHFIEQVDFRGNTYRQFYACQ